MTLFPPVYATLTGDPAIAAIVGGDVYRDIAEAAEGAYIVWSLLAAPPENSLDWIPPGDSMTFRYDCFAPTEREVDTLAAAVRNRVQMFGIVESMQSLGKDPDTGYWRMTIDADWFHHRN